MIQVASFFSTFGIPGADKWDIDCSFFWLRNLATRNNPPGTPTLAKNIEICLEYPHCHSNGWGDICQKKPQKLIATHVHLKVWVCIENEKIEKWKTSSPGEFDYAGEHVFRNAKMFLFFLSQTFKI